MNEGRKTRGAYAKLLNDIVENSDNLYIGPGNSVRARYKHPVPVNEFDLPLRKDLLAQAVIAAGGRTDWKGAYDVHHVGWPYSAYRALSTPDFESVGEAYRNSGGVKVRVPRQIHEYFHIGFDQPPIPAEDVMVQFLIEDMLMRRLLQILNPEMDERIEKQIDPIREKGRYALYLDTLASMQPSQVEHLPDIGHLATLSIDLARIRLSGQTSILKYEPSMFVTKNS